MLVHQHCAGLRERTSGAGTPMIQPFLVRPEFPVRLGALWHE